MRKDIMEATRLRFPAGTRLLLCNLLARQGRSPSIDVTVEDLARDLGVTSRSVRRALTELVEEGCVLKEVLRHDAHGGYTGLRIAVHREGAAA